MNGHAFHLFSLPPFMPATQYHGHALILLAALCTAMPVQAQKAVYRCETAGKVSYSHEPCVGAREIDTTPTQGMDRMSGSSRKGADVRQQEHDALMAGALKPLLGMTPQQYQVHKKRQRLSPEDRLACAQLDTQLPGLRQQVQASTPDRKTHADVDLYKARKRFNDLNC